jgi:NAD(P)H-hydrate epimerase
VGPEDLGSLARFRPDVVVDALLGTGTTPVHEGARWLREPIRSLCQWANRRNAPVLAVDIPTGLDASSGGADRDAIKATETVTLGALKVGLLVGEGPSLAGYVSVADIGIPAKELAAGAVGWRATDEWVAARLPPRPSNAHKYNVGRVLAITGSRDLTGAAVLATGAAYRAGAGAVVCCTPRSAQPVIDALRPEVMVVPQFESEEGTLGIAAYDEIVERMPAANAILIGCGLGRPAETQRLVRALLRRTYAPTVLDADGLNAFEGHAEKLGDAHAPLVLTPHTGELARLTGSEAPADRLGAVRELSARWNAVIALKGMPSIVGAPDGRVFVGPPPALALATAGTGDVLAGTIAGFLARGMEPLDAAVAALHVGSAAAERFEAVRGPGMMASDLLDEMPAAFRERFAVV